MPATVVCTTVVQQWRQQGFVYTTHTCTNQTVVCTNNNPSQKSYEIINIPCDFLHTNVRRLMSSRSWLYIVAVLKVKNCDVLKGSLAETLQFWSLVISILVWYRNPRGSPMKKAPKVYCVKFYWNKKVMTQHLCLCTWCFRTSSESK